GASVPNGAGPRRCALRSRRHRTAPASADDYKVLAAMAGGAGGIHHFGPAMSSVILAACQPRRFTVADSRALKTLRTLGLMHQARQDSGSRTGCPTSLLAA